MNSLLEKNVITEMVCGQNITYVLSDNSHFLTTEYKVLQSQVNSCFVKCMKMNYNGKIQLYYMTNKYKSFLAMLPTLDVDSFMTICANLLSDIIDVKNNGFLACQNIDISFEHIYVEPSTYKVYLMYLPLNERIYEDDSIFENEIRTGLIKVIADCPKLSSPKAMQFSSDLSDGTLAMETLVGKMKGHTVTVQKMTPVPDRTSGQVPSNFVTGGNMKVVAMNAPSRIEIDVTKDRFILGKNPALVDGVISFNNMISRKHCEITKEGGNYFITDLGSANGTYVNGAKIQPNVPTPIANGDIIRLANSDFQIVMG